MPFSASVPFIVCLVSKSFRLEYFGYLNDCLNKTDGTECTE